MELFDIVDEKGEPTGVIKERSKVHADGDLHRTSHVWIVRDNQVTRVYRMKRNDIDIEKLKLQQEEIESVIWMDYEACLEGVKNNTIKHCIQLEEFERIGDE